MNEEHTLATRLTRLFAIHRVTARQVAKAINATAGARVFSKQHLNQLLNGRNTEPPQEHLELLARYFEVSPEYFRDDAESRKLAQQYRLLAAISQDASADTGGRNIPDSASGQHASDGQAGLAELAARWPRMRPSQRAVLIDLVRTFTDEDQARELH